MRFILIAFGLSLFSLISGCEWEWGKWGTCSRSCGGGTRTRHGKICDGWFGWGVREKDESGACNEVCYNGGNYYGGSCHCNAWRTGSCCEYCRNINIPHCKSGRQECGGSPDSVRCTDCELPYTPAGWGNGCKRIPCNDRNGGCGHLCVTERGVPKCVCRQGYILSSNGYSCSDIDECKTGEANCNHNCINSQGSFRCTCQSGYSLDSDKFHCSDVDECLNGVAKCNQKCENTAGSFHCACLPGYKMSSDGHTCIDVNECSINNGGCKDVCVNEIGSFYCKCKNGYRLNASLTNCIDIDECGEAVSKCSQSCHNIPGSYTCSCNQGYKLLTDGFTCSDIDYCIGVVCDNGGSCQNNIGSYTCSCLNGFTGKRCEEDVNECSGFLNGGCEDLCINTIGSFQCKCSGNKTLNDDGFSCAGSEKATKVFERYGIARSLLPRGCSTILLTKCTEGQTIDVYLSSTSPWFRLKSNTSFVYTLGIVFVEVNALSLPVSIKGMEIVFNGNNFAVVHGVDDFITKDSQKVGTERQTDCVTFNITPRDIHDILASFSFLKSFFDKLDNIVPDWLSLAHKGTKVLGINDLQTELSYGKDILRGEFRSAPVHENRLYTVLKFGGHFSVSLYGDSIALPEAIRNHAYCIIIDICQDLGGSFFLMFPEESRNVLNQIKIIKDLSIKNNIEIRPVGLGLSLAKHINVRHSATSLQFWNGDRIFSYPIMPEANLWIGGEFNWIIGKEETFSLTLKSESNIYVSIPHLQSILKSVFLDKWDIMMRVKASSAIGIHFPLFGKRQTIALKAAQAEVNVYASLGGLQSRSMCGSSANPPGIFLSALIDINPFIGIPVLEDWVIDFKSRVYAFVANQPQIDLTKNKIDIFTDIIDIKHIVGSFIETTGKIVFRYSSVLTNTSKKLLNDIQKTGITFLHIIENIANATSASNSIVLENVMEKFMAVWSDGWIKMNHDAQNFIDSIEYSTHEVKEDISAAFLQELQYVKTNITNVINKLTDQVLGVLRDVDGFGIKYKGEIKIFNLLFAGLEVEIVYSKELGTCSRFASLYEIFKGEQAIRVFAVVSGSLRQLAPFISVNGGFGLEFAISNSNIIGRYHAQISFLGIIINADIFLTPRGHHFIIEGDIMNTFKAQLKVSFESGKNWNAIDTLDVEGKLLANAGDGDSFQDSYLDAFKKLTNKIAEEAEQRISKVQEAFTVAQRGLTVAQNWLEDKKTVIRSANVAFDKAVQAMEYAKQKLEEAKGPFKSALSSLSEAQRKVDNLCAIKHCRGICIPGIKCKICKLWFLPVPCCTFTSCMFTIPDPLCIVYNAGCYVVRGIAYVALEAAKIFVRIPMLALDAAKLVVSGAQFIVDKSRVVLDIAIAAIDLAKLGLEGAKIILEGAKFALEAVKKVVGWGLKALSFIITYGIQSLIDIRNCGFEARVSVTGSTVFHVECEINLFKTGFKKITLGINFANPFQSVWQSAKGTVDAVVDASKQSDRRKREIRSKALSKLHRVIRETSNNDTEYEDFDIFVNETLNTVLYTSGFKNNSSLNDYDNRVVVFKEKCEVFDIIYSFFAGAFQILHEMTNETAHTLKNVSSIQDTLGGFNLEDLASNFSMENIGINPDVAMSDFNISVDELNNALDGAKRNLSNDPVLAGIEDLAKDAKSLLDNQTHDVNNARIVDHWIVLMNNKTHEYFEDDKCASFQDCSHYAVFQLYSLFDAVNITDMEESLDAISKLEDLYLELIGNTSHTIPDVYDLAKHLSETLELVKNHNFFCSDAPTLEPIPTNHTLNKGATLRILCNATGNPPPSIWWYRDGQYIPDQHEKSLVIYNVSKEDEKKYYCVAGNVVANITSPPFEVSVIDDEPTLSEETEMKLETVLQWNSLSSSTSNGIVVEKPVDNGQSAEHAELSVILGPTITAFILIVTVTALVIWRQTVRKKNRKSNGVGSVASLNMIRPDVVSKPALNPKRFGSMTSVELM